MIQKLRLSLISLTLLALLTACGSRTEEPCLLYTSPSPRD